MEGYFSQRLKELRQERDLTLDQVADGVNKLLGTKISKGQLSRFENGNGKPSIDNAIALSIFFNVSVDYFIGLSDDRQVKQLDRIIAYIQRVKEKSDEEV